MGLDDLRAQVARLEAQVEACRAQIEEEIRLKGEAIELAEHHARERHRAEEWFREMATIVIRLLSVVA